MAEPVRSPAQGAQRLPMDRLKRWEQLEYGMFIHFGMSTYDGDELSKGDRPSSFYAPDRLDVDQWVQVARDAGMKYAILTTKHVAGHCLWPTRHTDYQIGTSGNKTDVVAAFVEACAKHGIMPGFYYCSWDNHHLLGSMTPTYSEHPFTTQAYRDFQCAQIEELLTQYGTIGEVWIDIPGVLGHEGRRRQYEQISRLQPDAVIMLNQGLTDGSKLNYDYAWPTDLMAIERHMPHSNRGYCPWHHIANSRSEAADYYLPAEVCDPIGYDWFWTEKDRPRSDAELLGMRLVCRERHTNLVLNVPPDPHGMIPRMHVDALMRLCKNLEKIGA